MNDLLEIGVELFLFGVFLDEFLVLKEVEEDIVILVDESGKVLDIVSEVFSMICWIFCCIEDCVCEKLEFYLCDCNVFKMLSDVVIMIWNDCYVILVK